MGTLAAGIKEIFATAKTTGSNVMLCGNDGTPDGHMTMANLASVLGATFLNVDSGDFNSITNAGIYAIGNMQSIANCPPLGSYGVLTVSRTSGMIIHHFEGYEVVYRRFYFDGEWTTWLRLDNFGCNTPSELANALDGVTTYSYRVTANTEIKCFYGGGIFTLWLNNETENPLVFISSNDNNGAKITRLNTPWFDANITIIKKSDHYVYITYTSGLTINIKKLI